MLGSGIVAAMLSYVAGGVAARVTLTPRSVPFSLPIEVLTDLSAPMVVVVVSQVIAYIMGVLGVVWAILKK